MLISTAPLASPSGRGGSRQADGEGPLRPLSGAPLPEGEARRVGRKIAVWRRLAATAERRNAVRNTRRLEGKPPYRGGCSFDKGEYICTDTAAPLASPYGRGGSRQADGEGKRPLSFAPLSSSPKGGAKRTSSVKAQQLSKTDKHITEFSRTGHGASRYRRCWRAICCKAPPALSRNAR